MFRFNTLFLITMNQSSKIFVDVILPVPVQQIFTYNIPDKFRDKIQAGCRVIVQFGNRKLYTGLIKHIHHNKPTYDTKPIETVLDEKPMISPLIFSFWEWISNYYMCSQGEVMKAALPAGLKLESQTNIILDNNYDPNQQISPTENTVIRFLENQKKTTIQQITRLTNKNNAYPVIKSLLEKRIVQVEEKITERYKPKTIAHIKIADTLKTESDFENAFESMKKAKKQVDLFMLIINELNFFSPKRKPSVAKKEILKISKSSESTLKSLEKRKFIEIIDIEIDRLSESNITSNRSNLNKYQENALNQIHNNFKKHDVVLLHGITASGKTEIYIQMIEEQLKAGKQVLYLLPEIALTSQIITRLSKVFGSKAGIYHSKFNDSERIEIWNKVQEYTPENQQNKYQLILGARSSLFLPFTNLGLIIVDEEHESSYKQFDPAPRYNARDSAVVLAKFHNAKVLMGTATPSFESFFNAKTNKYGYVLLNRRHHEIELPITEIADIKDAYKRKQMISHFTPGLFNEIKNTLEKNEQIILFQNRRGFSPFIQCRTCGFIPTCKHCDVSLTYHKYFNNLQCHYCGYTTNLPAQCPQCGSNDMQTKGFGTEKIEDEIKILFPNTKIGRLDLDASRSKTGYENVIENFASGKTQILVGTQMITKGLDFDNVSLVGILNADNMLNYPDFRAFERAFQLMAQVSGRAGRKNKQGKVIIQTSQPKHKVFDYIVQNKYEDFFHAYINERKLFRYPPWYRLIYISIKHKNRDRAITASKQFAAKIRGTFKDNMLGPEFHLINRVQQYYQLIIRLKIDKNSSQNEHKNILNNAVSQTKTIEGNASVIFTIDVDPV